MPYFKLTIKSIACKAVTDSLLEGNRDEVYVRVWHQKYSSILILNEISLGEFEPKIKRDYNAVIFEGNYPDITTLGFDFYDSDVFSMDDLLGGFLLASDNTMKLGLNTSSKEDKSSHLQLFNLTGSGGNYDIEAFFEVA